MILNATQILPSLKIHIQHFNLAIRSLRDPSRKAFFTETYKGDQIWKNKGKSGQNEKKKALVNKFINLSTKGKEQENEKIKENAVMRIFQTWGKIETRIKARARGDEKTRDIKV